MGARRRRRRRSSDEEETRPDYVKYLVVLFGAAAIVVAVVMGTPREEPVTAAHDHSHEHDQSPAVPVSLRAKEIASHFVCACGSCGELELATCSCGTAAQERQLIQAEMDRGASNKEIMQLVHDRYGGLKPQFAGLVEHR